MSRNENWNVFGWGRNKLNDLEQPEGVAVVVVEEGVVHLRGGVDLVADLLRDGGHEDDDTEEVSYPWDRSGVKEKDTHLR